MNLSTFWFILPYALILAAIGLIESLMTLNLVDDLQKLEETQIENALLKEVLISLLVCLEVWVVVL